MGICQEQTARLVKVFDACVFTRPSLKWEAAGPAERTEIEDCLRRLIDAFEVPVMLPTLVRVTREQVDLRCKQLGATEAQRASRQRKAQSKIISAVMLRGLTPRFITGLMAHNSLGTLLTKTINQACMSLLGVASEKGVLLQDPELTERIDRIYTPRVAASLKLLMID